MDRKTCKKKRIASDLYYYYGEIDYKINASLAAAYEQYIKKVFLKICIHFINIIKYFNVTCLPLFTTPIVKSISVMQKSFIPALSKSGYSPAPVLYD